MGRKIPGKKHRGVKDPEKQQRLRFNSLKDKINAPPTNPDEQDVPKSLVRLMELKEKTKKGEFNKKKKRATKDVPKKPRPGKPEKPVPVFKQNIGESDRHFLYRVNQMTQAVIRETAFEEKYKVEVKRNAETGKVEKIVKSEKDELELLVRKAKKEKKKKPKKKADEPKLTKAQKRQLKLREKKKLKKSNEIDEFDKYTDNVRFGETVHEPPTLVTPRRVEKLNSAPRPGAKDLHLKSLFGASEKKSDPLRKTAKPVIDRKGKRKDLPNALRRQLDKQQKEVIEAYKNLKKRK